MPPRRDFDPAVPPFYPVGLDLRGRQVLVAGAGRVAARRIPRLLDAGALVTVVAPRAEPLVRELAEAGRLVWLPREVRAPDVAQAWYVLAATDSPEANELVGGQAEQQRIFCVRCDLADAGTARTPAVLDLEGFRLAVLGHGDPRGAMRLRDRVARALSVPASGSTPAGGAGGWENGSSPTKVPR